MKQALLVARHEFIETVRQPAFYLSFIILIGAMFLGATVPRFIQSQLQKDVDVLVVDHNGGAFETLGNALKRQQRLAEIAQITGQIRTQLKAEFKKGGARHRDLPPIFNKNRRALSTADAEIYEETGGAKALIEQAQAYIDGPPPSITKQPATFHIDNVTITFESMKGSNSERAQVLLRKDSERATPENRVLMVIPEDFNKTDPAKTPIALWTLEALDPELAGRLRLSIDQFAADIQAKTSGQWQAILDYDASYGDIRFHALNAVDRDEGHKELNLVPWLVEKLPVGLLFLVVIVVTIQSIMLLTNTMEEKSNRIVEVILSSMSPHEFMMGKLIGPIFITGFVAILLIFFGSLAGVLFAGFSSVPATLPPEAMDAAGHAQMEILDDAIKPLVTGLLPKLPVAILYAALAYLTYAGIFLSVGAFCTDIKQVQTMAAPLNLSLMAIEFLSIVAALEPDQSLAKILTWLPPTSPFVMVGRLGSDLPWWVYAGTIAMQTITVYFLLRLAGRVFKQAALRSGGLPSLREVGAMIRGRV